MRKNIVAGNWKMNTTLPEGIALAEGVKASLAGKTPKCDVILGVPFTHLASVAEVVKGSVIKVSAENCAAEAKGAYTGEVSAAMVKSTGVTHVILGHSERRSYYGETSEILVKKVRQALDNGLEIIFCIGEVLEDREAGRHFEVVEKQVKDGLFNLTEGEFRHVVLAYEPVWAIGTGKTATSEEAQEMHAHIRKVVASKYGEKVAEDTTILYGGSAKASNAPELFSKPDVDGGLIGGASLKAEDFLPIIKAFK